MYLAAAGVGTIGIADADEVNLSNLQRQVIHTTADLGKAKVKSAKETMQAINPDVKVNTYRRDALGCSRRCALLLLEHWDASGVTRRQGEGRIFFHICLTRGGKPAMMGVDMGAEGPLVGPPVFKTDGDGAPVLAVFDSHPPPPRAQNRPFGTRFRRDGETS